MSTARDPRVARSAAPAPGGAVISRLHWGAACGSHDASGTGPFPSGCTVVICTHQRPQTLVRFLDSLAIQTRLPDRLVIVDASSDADSEIAVRDYPDLARLARCVLYFRVGGSLKGLTRQRNFALRSVETDLLVFFDDDVVLEADCLSEMEETHRRFGAGVVGVGAAMENDFKEPRPLWRMRRRLGIIPTLQPGRYTRSGFSIPWGYLGASLEPADGDWLPGCGMMWRTETVAELRFHEPFEGYAQGEDLDFSLRARRKGRLVLAPTARLQHLCDPAGRPNDFRLGYSGIYNRYEIHREVCPTAPGRTWPGSSTPGPWTRS